MLQVGITGGIGAGKSVACKVFQSLGIPIYSSDDWAKWLMNHEPILKASLAKNFGEDIYSDEGILNTGVLSAKVFSQPAQLEKLNSLVHPAVALHYANWVLNQNSPYILKEAALLFESDSFKGLHYIIVVEAPDNERIERVMARSGLTNQQVLHRMQAQLPQEEKIARANFVLHNGNGFLILPQILEIHQRLLALSALQNQTL